MKYLKSKIRQLNKHIDEVAKNVVVDGVSAELTNLVVADSSELVVGQAYSCTIAPSNGFYLPPVISVTGTTSAYGFKYDHTTGVIYIPSDEVIGDIIITAEASDMNWNIPAQFEVAKITSNTYLNKVYEQEKFLLINVTPSRGSSVNVTYEGVTKTVTGHLSTGSYDSTAIEVVFGTYHGVTDDVETPDSGILTISGAYESYDLSVLYNTDNKSEATSIILNKIINIGAPRYLCGKSLYSFADADESNVVVNFPLGMKDDSTGGIFGYNGSITFDKMPYIYTPSDFMSSLSELAMGSSEEEEGGNLNAIYFNNVDMGEWYSSSRFGFLNANTNYINGEDVLSKTEIIVPENCKHIANGSFWGFHNVESIYISKTVNSITNIISDIIDCQNERGYIEILSLFGVTSLDDVPEDQKETVETYIQLLTSNMTALLFSMAGLIYGYLPYSCVSLEVDSENPVYYSENNCVITKNDDKVLVIGYDPACIPNNVKSIGTGAFMGVAHPYNNINFPSNLIKIGDFAFSEALGKFETLTIPDGVTHIGNYAFSNMTNLQYASSDSGEEVDISEMAGIHGLLTLPNSIESIGDYAFATNCGLSGDLILPDGLTFLGEGAFEYAGITSVTIPSSLTRIGSLAFAGTALTDVTISDGVEVIGANAFGSVPLQNVIIPSSVTKIEDVAFNAAITVTMLATTPPIIGETTFDDDIQSIIVPAGAGDVYKAAENWSEFADVIVEAT